MPFSMVICFANSSSFWGVFWVDVSSASLAKSSFIALARLLGSSVENIDEARQMLANFRKPWLLVLDNADNPEFDYQEYFPSGTWGTIIMTSRVSDCCEFQTVGSVTLESLDEGECVQLLLKVAKIPSHSWSSHEQAAKIIAKDLSCHTLALIQAGAYIAKRHCSMEEYPAIFRRNRERLLKFSPKQAKSRYSDIFTTFEASASLLKSSESTQASDALCLLEILSMLHFNDLPTQLFEDAWKGAQIVRKADPNESNDIDTLSEWHVAQLPKFLLATLDAWDPFRLHEASHLLASLFLITEVTRNGFLEISMHSLVHTWLKNRLSSNEQIQVWSMTGSILALSFYCSQPWQLYYRQLQPHVHSYINLYVTGVYSLDQNKSIASNLLHCGWGLSYMRDDILVARLLKRLTSELDISSSHPSIKSKELLPLYDLQAQTLYYLREYTQSAQLLEQIVDLKNAIFTNYHNAHNAQLFSQYELASAYLSINQIEQGIQLLEHVVSIHKETLSENHSDRLSSQHELARAYLANNQIEQAIQLFEQVVSKREETLSESHAYRLTSQHALACAYLANDQIEQAIQLFKQVVSRQEETLSENHSDRLASQQELARAYLANNQIKQAVHLFEHVIKIRNVTLTEHHLHRLIS